MGRFPNNLGWTRYFSGFKGTPVILTQVDTVGAYLLRDIHMVIDNEYGPGTNGAERSASLSQLIGRPPLCAQLNHCASSLVQCGSNGDGISIGSIRNSIQTSREGLHAPNAVASASAFARVSAHSCSGELSATMPAPT